MMRVFSVVARRGSFTSAAEELDMAVQTVSKYVKALEERLDVQLFDRTTRKVNLNATGTAYLERCNDLIGQFDEIENAVKQQNSTPQGRIRITAPTAFGELHLLPALAQFQRKYADISLDVDLSNRKVSLVDEGVDLAIRIGNLPDSALVARKLAPMRLCLCASPEYLVNKGTPKLPKDLKTHNCLIDANYRGGRHWMFNVDGELQKVEVNGYFTGNSPKAIRQMALAGVGIGFCPMYVISQDVISGKLTILFDKWEANEMGVYALYPHRKHLSVRVRVLVDFLAAQFRKMN